MADEEIGARLSLKNRREFSADAERAAKDVKKIGDEAKTAERKGKDMGSSFEKVGRGIMSAGRVGAMGLGLIGAAATGVIGLLGGMGLQALISAEQTEIGFTTMLGSAEKARAFMGELEAFAAKTPFEMQGLTSAAQGLLAFGFAAEDILPMLTAVGDAAGGLSAGTEGINRMTRVLGQIKAKGKATTEDLMQMAEMGVPVFDILADKLGITIPQAMEQVTKGQIDAATTIEALLGGMNERFGGLMEKQSTSIGGLWSTLMDTIRIKSKNVLAPFADDMRAGLTAGIALAERIGDWLIVKIPPAIEGIKKEWPTLFAGIKAGDIDSIAGSIDRMLGSTGMLAGPLAAVMNLFSDIGLLFTDLIIPVWTDLNDVVPVVLQPMRLLRGLLRTVAHNGKVFRPILFALVAGFTAWKIATIALTAATAIGNAVRFIQTASTAGLAAAQTAATASTGSLAAGTGALNTVMAMNPIVLVVIALAALAAGLYYAYKHSETFRNAVDAAWGVLKTGFNWVKDNWPLLLAILTGPIGLAVLAIVKNWDDIKNGFTTVKDWIGDRVDDVAGFFTELPGRIATATTGMWDGIKNGFIGVVNAIIDAWNSIDIGFDISIPDWVPKIGGKGWKVNDLIPDISRLGGGGGGTDPGFQDYTPGGGPKGAPQVAALPATATVASLPADVSNADIMGPVATRQPMTLQVVLDRKVVAEATYTDAQDRFARR